MSLSQCALVCRVLCNRVVSLGMLWSLRWPVVLCDGIVSAKVLSVPMVMLSAMVLSSGVLGSMMWSQAVICD